MPSITIAGSCVTRDAFEFDFGKYSLQHYFARTSIVSLMSAPVPIDENDIKLDSKFQRKCVYNDLSKNFFREIKETKSDFIILDLIDERFNLLKTGDSFITNSHELKISKYSDKLSATEIKRDETQYPLWEKAAKMFFEKLFLIYKPSEVILHKTFWKECYYDNFGTEQPFIKNIYEIRRHNKLLDMYYNYIEENFPNISVIDMKETGLISSEKHMWGIAPFHYEDTHYHYFLLQLDEISQNKGKKLLTN